MKKAASVGGLFFAKKNGGYGRTRLSPVINCAKRGAALKTTPIERV
jgi:hypothetical protein